MKSIAIEGLDGSGKTSAANSLVEMYENEGLNARVVATYRLANAALSGDIYPMWQNADEAGEAVDIVKSVISDETKKANKDDVDVLIFDRHWMTAFTEISDKPELVEKWGDIFVPTAYLRVNENLALQRSQNDLDKKWMGKDTFNEYFLKYESLLQSMGGHILGIYRNDNDVSIEQIARSIKWDLDIPR